MNGQYAAGVSIQTADSEDQTSPTAAIKRAEAMLEHAQTFADREAHHDIRYRNVDNRSSGTILLGQPSVKEDSAKARSFSFEADCASQGLLTSYQQWIESAREAQGDK